MTDKSRMDELIPLYALGVLEGEELREAESLLDTPRGRELLREYEEVNSLLPYAAKGIFPSPELRKKLLAEIKKSHAGQRAKSRVPFFGKLQPLLFGLGGAVAAAAIVFLLVWNLSLRGTLNDQRALVGELNERVTVQQGEIKTLNNLLALKESEVGSLETKLASLEEITEFMEDPNIVLIALESRKPETEAAGRVLWDRDENDALFYSLNLPVPPPGKTYQWWVVADGDTKSVGVFESDSDGNSVVKIDSLREYGEDIDEFRLTLEPEGGAETPTGTAFLSGQSI
ncbi:MAG: anti-sigma factor [Deltaproteobacteria bacterium]